MASVSLPKDMKIVKYEISRVNSRGCTVVFVLSSTQSKPTYTMSPFLLLPRYQVCVVQCSITTAPSMKVITADVPVMEENGESSPCGVIYNVSANNVWLLFTSGMLVRYQLMPDLSTGKYSLQVKQSIQMIHLPQTPASDTSSKSKKTKSKKARGASKQINVESTPSMDWDPFFTAIGDRCVAFVAREGLDGQFTLRFVETEYMAEIRSIALTEQPTGLAFRKSHFSKL